MYTEKEGIQAVCRDMELGLSTYSIAQHVKCDLARPWVRGALKKNLIQELAENGEIKG